MEPDQDFDYERVKTLVSLADTQSEMSGSHFLIDLVTEHPQLLEQKFWMNESTNLTNYDENFIHMLIKYGKLEDIITFITEFGDKSKEKLVTMLNQENKVGWLPIYYAFQHKSVELVKLLHGFDKSQVKHICNNGSALIKAAEVSNSNKDGSTLGCVKFLIEDCKLDINQTDKEGCTALYMACYKCNYEIAKYLLENGADPSILWTNGSTPLHICAERDFLEILQLLCAKRADLVFAQDEEGNTPLHIASLWSHMEILEFLWAEGGQKLVNVKNNDGLTAIELAYEENQLYAHEFLWERMGIKPNSLCSIL